MEHKMMEEMKVMCKMMEEMHNKMMSMMEEMPKENEEMKGKIDKDIENKEHKKMNNSEKHRDMLTEKMSKRKFA